jgi:hypothetical protein
MNEDLIESLAPSEMSSKHQSANIPLDNIKVNRDHSPDAILKLIQEESK